MDLQEVGRSRGDWMELAQDRDRWWALVGNANNGRHTVTNSCNTCRDTKIFSTLQRNTKQNLISTLTLRRLMSYIYGAPILDVSRSHTMTQHSR